MGSITDTVTEGLKYPFNDGKKVLVFGLFFTILNIIFLAMEYLSYASLKEFEASNVTINLIPQVSSTNSIFICLLAIFGLVVLIYILGYNYDVIKFSIESKKELPGFSNPVERLKNGLKYLICVVAYLILPTILFALGLMLGVNNNVGAAVNNIGLLLIGISVVLFIFVYFLEIMAVSNLIKNDKFSAAFDFKGILNLISNLGWVRFIGGLIFLTIIQFIIVMFCNIIISIISNLIGIAFSSALIAVVLSMILMGLIVNPFINIFVSRVYGSFYRAANGELMNFE
ncbi:DUF4013 domain-containing protein [uncultured Methanobrevibacter sp.]|uniref:DUF4013 domain-containing protein n=1 Tax=uncultured Methanobrevibacter sp. TaxID=253161 RepID=UPI002627AF79